MAAKNAPRSPDYILKALVRPGAGGPGAPDGAHNSVGAVWINEDEGTISISLRPGVTLSWDDGLQLTAFPFEPGPKR